MEANAKSYTRIDAENFVRNWNLFFNRSTAYSLDHPAVIELLPKVHSALEVLLEPTGNVSVLLQEIGYYIGSFDLAYQPNTRKIADHLRRFGIESISFSSPISTIDLGHILEATALTHADPQSFLRYVASRGVPSLSVNNVTLQTVKEGESVTSGQPGLGDGLSTTSGTGWTSGGALKNAFEDVALRVVLGHITAQEMSTNLSVLQMLQTPGNSLPQALAQVSASAPSEAQEGALQQALANTLGAFAGSAKKENANVEDLLTGMYNMRAELLKSLKAQEGLSLHLREGNQLPESAEAVFENAAADLIVQEYRRHGGNTRKMADVIQRIVPEKKHLHGVLNKVRESLIKSGVPLSEYYNLLSELNVRMSADQGYQEFLRIGTGIGLSPHELTQEIQNNPKQAAQLIMLAGELRRQGKGGGAEDLIDSLTSMVENAGDEISRQAEQNPRDAGRLAGMLFQFESEVSRELNEKPISEELKSSGRQRLQLRLQKSLGDVKHRAALAQLRMANVPEAERIEFFLQTFSDEKELDEMLSLMGGALANDSIAQQVSQQILAKVRQEMKTRKDKAISKELPPGVYVKAVLDFFLKFEVSRSLRYNIPFSAVLVSFQGLPEDKESQDKYGDTLRGLQNVLVGDMRRLFRDSDFVGYLTFNRFLIVAPMTVAEATTTVVKKIRDHLTRQVALPDGTRAWIRPRCGCGSFDKENVNTYQKFYQELQKHWQADA